MHLFLKKLRVALKITRTIEIVEILKNLSFFKITKSELGAFLERKTTPNL